MNEGVYASFWSHRHLSLAPTFFCSSININIFKLAETEKHVQAAARLADCSSSAKSKEPDRSGGGRTIFLQPMVSLYQHKWKILLSVLFTLWECDDWQSHAVRKCSLRPGSYIQPVISHNFRETGQHHVESINYSHVSGWRLQGATLVCGTDCKGATLVVCLTAGDTVFWFLG